MPRRPKYTLSKSLDWLDRLEHWPKVGKINVINDTYIYVCVCVNSIYIKTYQKEDR